MLDNHDRLISGIQSNLFMVQQGVMKTPRLDRCGVAGRMRARILACASTAGIPIYEDELRLDDLVTADEVFLSNSLIGIWPVIRCIDPAFKDNAWGIGKLTGRLQSLLAHPSLS